MHFDYQLRDSHQTQLLVSPLKQICANFTFTYKLLNLGCTYSQETVEDLNWRRNRVVSCFLQQQKFEAVLFILFSFLGMKSLQGHTQSPLHSQNKNVHKIILQTTCGIIFMVAESRHSGYLLSLSDCLHAEDLIKVLMQKCFLFFASVLGL